MFDLSRLAAANLVAQIDYHDELGSTSDRALALAASDAAALPLLVLAARQTSGRGRGTNRWIAAEGALTFSLALAAPPEALPPHRWPEVALVAGLAVCEALQSLAPQAELRVKWPNDVFLGGRKICGILSESVPGWRERLVVGIGVNVNNRVQGSGFGVQEADRGQASGVWQRTAVSLIEQDGLARDLTVALVTLLDHFDRRWSALLAGGFAPLAAAYCERCFLTGKSVTIQQPGGGTLVGHCRGIDDEGVLRLYGLGGELRVRSGTVVRWE
jgi:BirA family biotin operon repressor/biotin-[acetyl-CoA-carboxylase] ligase